MQANRVARLAAVSMIWFLAIRVGACAAADARPESPLLPPAVVKAARLSEEAHPLADAIHRYLEQPAPASFCPTELTRSDYLRLIAGQLHAMRGYQDDEGRIIDPVEKREMYYTTPCYAHAVAALLASGYTRDADLIESGMKALDVSLADMAAGECTGGHGDFYTWPAMFAYDLFRDYARAERRQVWQRDLQSIDAKKLYHQYMGNHNWGVANLAGEYLRHRDGFTSLDYVEASLEHQRPHFTDLGMYSEHGNPTAYDHFPRHFLAGMLDLGYAGEHFEAYRELLWRGAWTSLFLQSPFGELPTGYRSAHHIWNEAEQCVTFELYARAYAQASRPIEAGAFRRAARLSLAAIARWIRPDGSGYVVKNRYPIQTRHGYESYSMHTCYNMLACSMLAQAWQFSDIDIVERPAPADVGGFVIPVLDPFHKIVANAAGNYIEYDTTGDKIYNPTGLLRIHLKGADPQLGPSDGCAKGKRGGRNLAVGPALLDTKGKWHYLADANSIPEVEVVEESPSAVRFRTRYAGSQRFIVTQDITVDADGVTVTDTVQGEPIKSLRLVYPALVFDGEQRTEIELLDDGLRLRRSGPGVQLRVLSEGGVRVSREGKEYYHANGLMDAVYFDVDGPSITYRISPDLARKRSCGF